MNKKRFPRLVRINEPKSAATADHNDPAALLIAKEEERETQGTGLPFDGGDLNHLLAHWIGDLNPLRSIAITAAIAQVDPPSRPEKWLLETLAETHTAADLRQRIARQLRLIHRHTSPGTGSGSSADDIPQQRLAALTLQWLLGGQRIPRWRLTRDQRSALVRATRGVYCLASRLDPALIAHQKLHVLGSLWCVTSEALSNQTDGIFDGTQIAGAYNDYERHMRAKSAQGNHSKRRSHVPSNTQKLTSSL